MYFTFFNILKDNPKRIYYMLEVVAISVFGEAIYAVYQNFSGVEALASWQDQTGVNPEQLMTRVYGSLQPFNPNLLAGYLVASISSTAGLFFICALKKKFRLSALALIAFLVTSAAIVFTGSRGAYISLFIIFMAIILSSGHIIWHDFKDKVLYKKLWLFIIFAGILGLLLLVITSPAIQHRILSIGALRDDSSNSFRLNVYAACLHMIRDNWLIGIGPGNETFRLIYGLYMRTGFDALGAYSVPLEIAVESGVFALLAFLGVILTVFITGVKTVLSNNNIEQKIVVLICVFAIIGIMGHGITDTIFFRPQVQILFWLFLAILRVNILKYSIY